MAWQWPSGQVSDSRQNSIRPKYRLGLWSPSCWCGLLTVPEEFHEQLVGLKSTEMCMLTDAEFKIGNHTDTRTGKNNASVVLGSREGAAAVGCEWISHIWRQRRFKDTVAWESRDVGVLGVHRLWNRESGEAYVWSTSSCLDTCLWLLCLYEWLENAMCWLMMSPNKCASQQPQEDDREEEIEEPPDLSPLHAREGLFRDTGMEIIWSLSSSSSISMDASLGPSGYSILFCLRSYGSSCLQTSETISANLYVCACICIYVCGCIWRPTVSIGYWSSGTMS